MSTVSFVAMQVQEYSSTMVGHSTDHLWCSLSYSRGLRESILANFFRVNDCFAFTVAVKVAFLKVLHSSSLLSLVKSFLTSADEIPDSALYSRSGFSFFMEGEGVRVHPLAVGGSRKRWLSYPMLMLPATLVASHTIEVNRWCTSVDGRFPREGWMIPSGDWW